MSSKNIIASIVVLIALVGGVIILTRPAGQNPVSQSSATSTVNNPVPSSKPRSTPNPKPVPHPSAKTFSITEVASHNSASSCWTAISGRVYDLTSWIGEHPGGAQAILSLCGIDGTQAFNNQHGGQARPAQELASFYIGDLR
jgi:cytochrome b involved in lipid metabolism